MSLRQIFLDTETTGIRVEDGHRIIEIGCLEMIDRKLTGRSFHHYLNPQREVERGAIAVHGITNEFLTDKPLFASIAADLIAFIQDAELIIHNAPFDVSFLNNELALTAKEWPTIHKLCRVIDTLQMARQLHVGQRNSLDALCKRYGIDLSKRDFHGALLDASLLARVYLAMTGGQGSFFDALTITPNDVQSQLTQAEKKSAAIIQHQFTVLPASDNELNAHHEYLQKLKQQGKCLWED